MRRALPRAGRRLAQTQGFFMTNHAPTFTSSNATGSFSEFANTTDSMALHQLTGTMNFKDSDHSDSHTTSATLQSAVVSGGTVIPASALASFNTAMSSQILTDSNGTGQLRWSFSDVDDEFDFLAKNQTLTLTYDIKVFDNHGGSVLRTVTITVTGTDDRPVISMPAMGTVTEQAGQTLSFSPDTAHIALSFVDQDLANTGHTATVTGVSASGNTDGILPGFLGTIELMSFFHDRQRRESLPAPATAPSTPPSPRPISPSTIWPKASSSTSPTRCSSTTMPAASPRRTSW